MAKSKKQIERDIAESLAKAGHPPFAPYQSTYGHGPAEWQSGYKWAQESARHETHAEMREILRQLSAAARNDFDRGMVAGYQAALGDGPKTSHATMKKATKSKKQVAARPTPYRIKLTPSEMQAVEFARGRYAWPDMLAAHAMEDGSIAFTESEMWQWTDDVDSDAEGGHSPFPLASDAFADKLQRFYDSRV